MVTLPETTPISEAAKLQNDLRRSGIEPYAWIANQSMTASELSDPILRMRAAAEKPLLERVEKEEANKLYSIPFFVEDPVLRQLLHSPQQQIS